MHSDHLFAIGLVALCGSAGASMIRRPSLAGRDVPVRKLEAKDWEKCVRDVPCVARSASEGKYNPEGCELTLNAWDSNVMELLDAGAAMGPYDDWKNPGTNCEIWLTNHATDKRLEYDRADLMSAVKRVVERCTDSDLVAIECDLVDDDDNARNNVRLEVFARNQDAAATQSEDGSSLSSIAPTASTRR